MSIYYWLVQIWFGIVGIGIGFIWYTYIIEPKKAVIEGLKDWWHESDNDI